MLEKTNIYMYIFIVVALLICIVYMLTFKSKESFVSLETVDLLPACANITPSTLLQAFDFDINKLSNALIDIEVDPSILRNTENYPKIASLLIQKGLLKQDTC
jgi:hypothetical protein